MPPKKRAWNSHDLDTVEEMRTRIKLLQDPATEVTVGAGKDKVTWNISKTLLIRYSEFFRAVCNQPFKESLENKVVLPDEDPVAFEVFVQWLYFQKLPSDIWMQNVNDNKLLCVSLPLILWVLADKLLVADFKACVMQKIFERHTKSSCFDSEEVTYCWANTAPSSKLREFILDHVVTNWTNPQFSYTSQLDWDKRGWLGVFARVPDVRNELILALSKSPKHHRKLKALEAYLDDDKDGDVEKKP